MTDSKTIQNTDALVEVCNVISKGFATRDIMYACIVLFSFYDTKNKYDGDILYKKIDHLLSNPDFFQAENQNA